jgi:hypothetical protein
VWIQFDSGEIRTSDGIEWKTVRIGARNLLNQQETKMGSFDLRYQFL